MASTHYSTYSQAAAQQAQPTHGYAQTTQAYGQQSYGTYGQPTDVSYTQAQITVTYGQTAYATSYGTTSCWLQYSNCPPGIQSACPGVRHWCLRYHHCYGHYHPGLLCSSVCLWHSACLPSLWAAAGSHRTCKVRPHSPSPYARAHQPVLGKSSYAHLENPGLYSLL